MTDAELWQRIVTNLLDGLVLTVMLVSVSMVAGNLLAVPIALARTSKNPVLWMPAYAYILFMRGTPLIVQMFMIYYGLAQFREVRQSFIWPILREPEYCAVIALSMNTAGYSAEILRGAIQNVPRGLREGGFSMGLTRAQVMRFITLPLAIRACLPSLANETVLLLKASAIVFTITVTDIMGEANIIRSQTFRTYEPLLAAAVLYLALTFLIVKGFGWIERRLNKDRLPPELTADQKQGLDVGLR